MWSCVECVTERWSSSKRKNRFSVNVAILDVKDYGGVKINKLTAVWNVSLQGWIYQKVKKRKYCRFFSLNCLRENEYKSRVKLHRKYPCNLVISQFGGFWWWQRIYLCNKIQLLSLFSLEIQSFKADDLCSNISPFKKFKVISLSMLTNKHISVFTHLYLTLIVCVFYNYPIKIKPIKDHIF